MISPNLFRMKKIYTLFFLFPLISSAQWEKITGPFGGDVRDLIVKAQYIFASTWGGGVFRSADSGFTWEQCDSNISNYSIQNIVFDLAADSNYIYAASNTGVFKSDNNGMYWQPPVNLYYPVNVIENTNAGVFAGTSSQGIYFSSDNGNTWTPRNNGLNNLQILSLYSDGNRLFAGTYGDGLYVSIDSALTWTHLITGFLNVNAVATSGSNIYAALNFGGVMVSTDSGQNWNTYSAGMNNTSINCIGISDSIIYAGSNAGLYASVDNGLTWNETTNGYLSDRIFNSIIFTSSGIFAGLLGGVYNSVDGQIWGNSSYKFSGSNISCIKNNSTTIFVSDFANGIYSTDNFNNNWNPVPFFLHDFKINSIFQNNNRIFAGTSTGIFSSADNGITWSSASNGLSSGFTTTFSSCGSKLLAGTLTGLFSSSNNGASWIQMYGTDIVRDIDARLGEIVTIENGVFYSPDCGLTWRNIGVGIPSTNLRSIVFFDSLIVVGTGGGVFITADTGIAWTSANNGLPITDVNDFAIRDDKLYAATGRGVYLSSDKTASWSNISSGLTTQYINCLLSTDSALLAGTYGNGLWTYPLSSIIGVDEIKYDEFTFHLFPNPSNTEVNLEITSTNKAEIKFSLTDIDNRTILEPEKVYFSRTGKADISIITSDLAEGMYFINVFNQNYIRHLKLMVLH
jgi:photosystem II stability/assembly factor-like uncharacterized protein